MMEQVLKIHKKVQKIKYLEADNTFNQIYISNINSSETT